MSIDLTIYILAYNRPEYLMKCLESINNQTYKKYKLIVLDNASSYNLIPVIKGFKDLKINYIRHSKNIHSYGNFKYAWNDNKKTPFFMIFHDDDIMHPKLIEHSLLALRKNYQAAWHGTHSITFKSELPDFPDYSNDFIEYLSAPELAYQLVNYSTNVTFSSVVYRSNIISEVDLDEMIIKYSILSDRPLLLKLAQSGGCIINKNPLVLYRLHHTQDSKTGPISDDNVLMLIAAYLQSIKPIWSKTIEREFFNWTALHIPDSFRRLNPKMRSSFKDYIKKARLLGVYKDKYFIKYLVGKYIYFKNKYKKYYIYK